MASKQSIEALKVANQTRFAARDIKQTIWDGEMTIREAISHPDSGVISLNKLLESQRSWGPAKTHKLVVRRLGMGPQVQYIKCRDLTERQRELIAYGVEDRDFWVLEAGLRTEPL